MNADGAYLLIDASGDELGKGDAKIILRRDTIDIISRSSQLCTVPVGDIISITDANFVMKAVMRDGRRLRLSKLGCCHEDLVRELHRTRNDLIMHDLLMSESLRKSGVKAELRPFRGIEGPCEVRLYETTLVILPVWHSLIRVRFSDIEGMESRDHVLRIALPSNESISLTMLGREMEPLWMAISDAMAELSKEVRDMLRSAYPWLDSWALEATAALLREGRAASRWEIGDISEELWEELNREVDAIGLASEREYLTSRGRKDLMRIGMKRSLSGGTYVWFAVPLLGPAGNAVAVEAMSSDGLERATHFFRIATRSANPKMIEGDLEVMAEACMDLISSGMREIGFCFQPIYLPEEQLRTGPWSRYRHALVLVPELRALRECFIGRVCHHGSKVWRAGVAELLAFNASDEDDPVR